MDTFAPPSDLILVDSPIWIDHIRQPLNQLKDLLAREIVIAHPFVTGEVILGSLAERERVITAFNRLPQLRVATIVHVGMLIEAQKLWGTGVGYVDAHLLAAVRLTPGTTLWTRDKRLHAQAERLGVAATV